MQLANRSDSKPDYLSVISFYHKQQTFTPLQEWFPSIHANDHYIILKPYKYKSTPNKPAASKSPFNPPFLSQTVHKRNLLFLLNSLSFFLRSLLRESTLDNGTKGRRRKNACLHITAVKPQQTRPKRTATVWDGWAPTDNQYFTLSVHHSPLKGFPTHIQPQFLHSVVQRNGIVRSQLGGIKQPRKLLTSSIYFPSLFTFLLHTRIR